MQTLMWLFHLRGLLPAPHAEPVVGELPPRPRADAPPWKHTWAHPKTQGSRRMGRGHPHSPLLPQRPLPWPSTPGSSRHGGLGGGGAPSTWFRETRVWVGGRLGLGPAKPSRPAPILPRDFLLSLGGDFASSSHSEGIPHHPHAGPDFPPGSLGPTRTPVQVQVPPPAPAPHSGSGGVPAAPPGAVEWESQPKERGWLCVRGGPFCPSSFPQIVSEPRCVLGDLNNAAKNTEQCKTFAAN